MLKGFSIYFILVDNETFHDLKKPTQGYLLDDFSMLMFQALACPIIHP